MIEYEEKMLRQRVERVKARLNEMFRDLKSKTLEVYTQLDEWITARFKVEIEATKDLTVFFKEAIEAEQKLPNYILLSGEKLFLDYGTLIYEPEPEPVPEPPVEKQSPDQFTIAQLKVFTKHMQQLAPSGVIGTKVLIDYFQKALVFAGSNDHLPESFFGTEPNSVQQAISGLDPFDTGFVSWRKFWMMQSKLLPIDLTQMAELKRSLDESGTAITMEKFLNILFWFEATNTVPGQYDRAGKAKESIYGKTLNL